MNDAEKLRELRERLKEIEWDWDMSETEFCPACGSYSYPKHEADCWLKKEIDELESVCSANKEEEK